VSQTSILFIANVKLFFSAWLKNRKGPVMLHHTKENMGGGVFGG
jgi:hypothetical protein